MQRIGVAEDFVGIVLLLASDRSSYISAQTIVVDGGLRPT
jgi:NAD(P)-dependent dehydrogenase (short-subunit alcohol dehydrogenase family)